MSPQLSSGTNLALLDAFELSQQILKYDSLSDALKVYSDKRIKHAKFCQTVSRYVTPIFQSTTNFTFVRDYLIQLVYKFPPTQQIMLRTLLGLQTGLFSSLDKRYY